MEAKELISHLNAVGFSIGCESSQLLITPAGKLTEELKQVIKENKSAILAELISTQTIGVQTVSTHDPVTVTEGISSSVLPIEVSNLQAHSDCRYSVTVTDASTDPVLVEVTIQGLASFTMEIPHAHYDGIALLQVIEQHSAQAASNLIGDTQRAPQR